MQPAAGSAAAATAEGGGGVTAVTPLLPAAAIFAAATATSAGRRGSDGGEGSGAGAATAAAGGWWAPPLEALREALRSLAAGRGDGGAVLHCVLAFLRAAAWGPGQHDGGGGGEGGGGSVVAAAAAAKAADSDGGAAAAGDGGGEGSGGDGGGGAAEQGGLPPAAEQESNGMRGPGDGDGGGGGGWSTADSAGSGDGGARRLVALLLRLAELYGMEPEPPSPAAAGAEAAESAAACALPYVAAALAAAAAALPATSRRQLLLPALRQPQLLLTPLLSRLRTDPRVTAAAALLHSLLECPAGAATLAAALGADSGADGGFGSGSSQLIHMPATIRLTAAAAAGDGMDVDGRGGAAAAVGGTTTNPYDNDANRLDPGSAVQLACALLDALHPDEWGEADGAAGAAGSAGGSWLPYDLPRRVLSLLAALLDAGHEELLAALCCPPWSEGYGLPQRLLELADSAASASGSDAPLEPVLPTPSNPSLRVVAACCVPPREWLQRLRLAQEALLLLKELLTGGGDGLRRAALLDLTSAPPDSDTPHRVDLATARLAAWPAAPPELLQPALAAAAESAPLAPWAARLAVAGGGGGRGCGGVVACSVEAVGSLAGSVRRRWFHYTAHRQQQQQQHMMQLQRQGSERAPQG
ncbi:hypothetical protein GPECTOR_58g575 [Gonium pectorale]|uniref:Uncharacterized protein n=1 Tax=Gonium pectorale TaxID=33097 RepID=A0A150G5G4_GONPE|nr:hypothetical protein GPECTOR_58g575 [Gonium pectorale]|eukprot:KXZ45126.1 hypothetical protein GPECTOR_58g575 [Gonium pectorale]